MRHITATLFLLTICLLSSLACDETNLPAAKSIAQPQPPLEKDLPITFGGFIQHGPEDQMLDGSIVV